MHRMTLLYLRTLLKTIINGMSSLGVVHKLHFQEEVAKGQLIQDNL